MGDQGDALDLSGVDLRHTFCTRFLYAVLPSELYWGDETLNSMNTFLAEDLLRLYEQGVTATWHLTLILQKHDLSI